ncbi:hypothetical protein M422DRAFT_269685 [Sphaerobolus stellatus SS14]|uniref:Uncharacterized protein n=1 Tax=Sphaerobolus stellatus (strain SS14) TaxID=990650 RepID=A0A0C9UUI9_SPHS4|nr:hypothetical protein M422DRAFT_269685 [Sphaerobolus stellatus SS14]
MAAQWVKHWAKKPTSATTTKSSAMKSLDIVKVSLPDDDIPAASKSSNSLVERNERFSLKLGVRHIWMDILNSLCAPDWDVYFPEQYKIHVEAVEDHECQRKVQNIFNMAQQNVYGKDGKALGLANSQLEEMRIFRNEVSQVLACEEEFYLLMKFGGLPEYTGVYAVKGLNWQGCLY